MTRREIAALCCHVVALIVLAWAIMYFVMMLQTLGSVMGSPNSDRYGAAASLVSTQVVYFGTLGCSLLLFSMALGWKARMFSTWMASDDPTPVTGPELSTEALMPVACAGVGLFAITRALPTFARVFALLLSTETSLGEIMADNEWKTSLIADALLAAWGLWLIVGNRGFVRLLMRARPAGGPELEQTKPDEPSPRAD